MMRRIAILASCAILSGLCAFFAEPHVHGNTDALLVLVTVVTVFAGFLVAIITIIGDPSLIPSGNWRIAESHRDQIEKRLITHTWLFMLYLVTIALLFVGALARPPENELPSAAQVWITRVYLFFGVASFVATFALPGSLLRFQRTRVDAEIDKRRALNGADGTVK